MKLFDFKSFLQENPKLLSKYVAFGTYALNKVVVPVTHVMEHLLTIQDIDLDTKPNSLLKSLLLAHFDTMDKNRYMLPPTTKVKQAFTGSFKRTDRPFRSTFTMEGKPFPLTPPLKVTKTVDQVAQNIVTNNLSESMNVLGLTPNEALSEALGKLTSPPVTEVVIEDKAVANLQTALSDLAKKEVPAPKKKAPKKKAAKPVKAKATVVKNASKSRSPKKANKS